MLDKVVIDQIIERETRKGKKERRDSGWQPIPLYKELELPREPLPPKEETPFLETPFGPIEIDIFGPEVDDNVIQTCSYTSLRYYS